MGILFSSAGGGGGGGTTPSITAAPTLSPTTGSVGAVLTCTTGSWTNSPTSYAYQWMRSGVDISGATASSYTTVGGDDGTFITCKVRATNGSGSSSYVTTSNSCAIGTITGAMSVTRQNITVNFASPTPVVQNFLGDWFIQTPCTVSSVIVLGASAPIGTGATRRHGCMINPMSAFKQGFDGRFNELGGTGLRAYDESLSITFPRVMANNESLICSESRDPEKTWAELGSSNQQGCNYMATFTFLNTLPSVNTFRPASVGLIKTLYSKDSINYSLLPGLAGFTSPTAFFNPDGAGNSVSNWNLTGTYAPDPAYPEGQPHTLESSPHLWYQWFIGQHNSDLSGCRPRQQQNWHGNAIAMCHNRLAVYSMTNLPNASVYAERLVQLGIEYLGMGNMTPGQFSWGYGAGYGGQHALPILYAGWLLGDVSFKNFVMANTDLFSMTYQFYYSTTPFPGYATGYPAGWPVGGPGAPGYPLFGDNKVAPTYGANNTDRDSHGRFNAVAGHGSDPAYADNPDGPGTGSGTRYTAVDGICSHYQFAGNYLGSNTIKAFMGARLWSHMAGQDNNWGHKAWIDFMDWAAHDPLVVSWYYEQQGDVYRFGGSGNAWMGYMYSFYKGTA